MNKQIEKFSFSPPTKLSPEKLFLAVTYFEATNYVFNITDQNKISSNCMAGHWNFESAEKTINQLNELLQLRSQNDIEPHVEEVRKRGNQIKLSDKE